MTKKYKPVENYQGGQTGLFFDFGLYESHDFVAASQMPYTLRFINLVEQMMKRNDFLQSIQLHETQNIENRKYLK